MAGIFVAPAAGLFGVEPNHVVDAENGDRRLGGELQRLDLGDFWLQDSGISVVDDDTLVEIQTDPLIV